MSDQAIQSVGGISKDGQPYANLIRGGDAIPKTRAVEEMPKSNQITRPAMTPEEEVKWDAYQAAHRDIEVMISARVSEMHGWNLYWCAKRPWSAEVTRAKVSRAEFIELMHDPRISMTVLSGKAPVVQVPVHVHKTQLAEFMGGLRREIREEAEHADKVALGMVTDQEVVAAVTEHEDAAKASPEPVVEAETAVEVKAFTKPTKAQGRARK